jgi:hypothetical protein
VIENSDSSGRALNRASLEFTPLDHAGGTEVVGPLQRAPRRIRPPFDMDGHEPAYDRRLSETDDQRRARCHADRVAALLEPLDGIVLGPYDHRIVEWLAGWDTSVIGTVASLFYRARATGRVDGVQ